MISLNTPSPSFCPWESKRLRIKLIWLLSLTWMWKRGAKVGSTSKTQNKLIQIQCKWREFTRQNDPWINNINWVCKSWKYLRVKKVSQNDQTKAMRYSTKTCVSRYVSRVFFVMSQQTRITILNNNQKNRNHVDEDETTTKAYLSSPPPSIPASSRPWKLTKLMLMSCFISAAESHRKKPATTKG